MDLREIGWDGVDWMDMAQDRDQWRVLVNTVLNLRVQHKHIMGFEPTIPVFQRANTVHALDGAATAMELCPVSM
jgi:hypothetical protein